MSLQHEVYITWLYGGVLAVTHCHLPKIWNYHNNSILHPQLTDSGVEDQFIQHLMTNTNNVVKGSLLLHGHQAGLYSSINT
jgi:hypothetical protein